MWQELNIEDWIAGRRSGLESGKEAASAIIEDVRSHGDEALIRLTRQFDGIELEELMVSEEEIEAAYDETDPKLVEALIEAETRISRFHEMQKKKELWLDEVEPGITLGIKTTPLERIGAYIPGGRASYPSTALMTGVPARIAGVREIVCTTPPPVHPLTLLACDIAGFTEIYRVGGAQAIAAMALGTETINPVQKIVGPGNIYVTGAKILLREFAEIDFPAGPSEIGIIADASANPAYIAADILAQAEHDPHAGCVLVTPDVKLAKLVGMEIQAQMQTEKRSEIITAALRNSGYCITVDLAEAITISNQLAPEHLSIQVQDPLTVLGKIQHAGSIFIGPHTPVACGDYASGTNHVLPTAGYAKTYSGLNVDHFCKTSTVQMITKDGLEAIGDVVETLAEAEGLSAHAHSVAIRRQ